MGEANRQPSPEGQGGLRSIVFAAEAGKVGVFVGALLMFMCDSSCLTLLPVEHAQAVRGRIRYFCRLCVSFIEQKQS